jgi:hypothetical protein
MFNHIFYYISIVAIPYCIRKKQFKEQVDLEEPMDCCDLACDRFFTLIVKILKA